MLDFTVDSGRSGETAAEAAIVAVDAGRIKQKLTARRKRAGDKTKEASLICGTHG
jgi:hypothetical protein